MTKTMKELRNDWITALRSGEYVQARGGLCRNGGYCCLGVAAKVIGISDDILEDTDSGGARNAYEDIKKAYGLEHSLGIYNDGSHALYTHNDSDKWNFNQIADLIETAPSGLFIQDE